MQPDTAFTFLRALYKQPSPLIPVTSPLYDTYRLFFDSRRLLLFLHREHHYSRDLVCLDIAGYWSAQFAV